MKTLYSFRNELLPVHQPERLKPEHVAVFSGTQVTEQWCILRPKQVGAVLHRVAEDLRDYFSVSMGLDVPVVTDARLYQQAIQLVVDPQLPARTFEIRTQAGIHISGVDERAVAQGCYFLEDEMNISGVPGLETGTIGEPPAFHRASFIQDLGSIRTPIRAYQPLPMRVWMLSCWI